MVLLVGFPIMGYVVVIFLADLVFSVVLGLLVIRGEHGHTIKIVALIYRQLGLILFAYPYPDEVGHGVGLAGGPHDVWFGFVGGTSDAYGPYARPHIGRDVQHDLGYDFGHDLGLRRDGPFAMVHRLSDADQCLGLNSGQCLGLNADQYIRLNGPSGQNSG
ncbi:hypothetical protein GOBAR_AA24456 [Gossypium barbadense]|uniref:Uncharacterized protein n=1 Tax=Gossypium barbadense TaxID=3634 RepID=A0A2P5WYP6_GOSBA|nr:hypothetical protein GOBAR_AA24456 [Gossypium barbadense]